MTTKTDIEEFMDGPLVTWFRSCLHDPDSLSDYDDLVDGVLIFEVLLLIDPEPVHHGVSPSLGNPGVRMKNIECIIKNIKALYEEELCQLVLVLPDVTIIGREPAGKQGLEEMKLLLLLLLGCAVQCPNKQGFIEKIKALPLSAQHSLVNFILQVTESQELVLTQEGSENVSNEILINHIKRLVKQRDLYMQLQPTLDEKKGTSGNSLRGSESQHLAVELADWKAKLRKQRQELEEKSEALSEAKEELEYNKSLVSKLKNEITDLKSEVRVCKAYRDEADALRERAERADRLEAEVTRYKERLADLDYYRSRVEELREDNVVLEETREMLEEQLGRARARGEASTELEQEILKLKQSINDLSLEREALQEKLQTLLEENARLALISKSFNQDNSMIDIDHIESCVNEGDNSLSEQLSSNAQARALRLELENRRLASTVESLQEAALTQTNQRILQLEKEKKKLSLQVEELEEGKRKFISHTADLEATVKNAQRDTKKMQDIRDSLQTQLQARVEDVERLEREKSRSERRLAETEELLAKVKEESEENLSEARSKVAALERDVTRLRQSIAVKGDELDKIQFDVENLNKEKLQMSKQIEENNNQISRLHEVEREFRELESRYEIDRATLAALQKELISEKLSTQGLKTSLEQLGLALDQLSDPEAAIDRILSSPEILKAVRERLGSREETSPEQSAQLEVEVATLQSQIASLQSQHTALQLANSQLAAEKEELQKEIESVRTEQHQMLVDQLTLQSLHEGLTTEYETLARERDTLKAALKEGRTEIRSVREKAESLKGEHSKLKEDFRNLFTASEKLKTEYRTAQEEYKNMKAEVARGDELKEELHVMSERIRTLEIQISKLHSQCEMLKQVKANLEEDRRSLMEHVTLLLGQYHELLTHSLEDKEHYHMEEKIFTDKLNNLCRQKEKLEEKIMEQYRKMDSCPSKKKSFGASLVRRVRKAGSDLISKSRRSWHEDGIRRGSTVGAGTDSDTSLEEGRNRQEVDLGLGNPGSRRTVYLSADENSASANDQDENKSHISEVPRSSTPQEQPPPVIVYNRLSVGAPASPATTPSRRHSAREKTDMWYEYGCV